MQSHGLGLYIHIPFCVKKCDYCDFLSFPVGTSGKICGSDTGDVGVFDKGDGSHEGDKLVDIDRYIQALVTEMKLRRPEKLTLRQLENVDLRRSEKVSLRKSENVALRRSEKVTPRKQMESVDTVFIGGGTPSLLSTSQMDRVFQGLYDNFDLSSLREFTIECNPGTVTEEKLRLYRSAGVNRISFGMQSAVEKELRALGRIHTFREFQASYRLARKAGFDNINIDVMFAIPGQTKESYDDTLSQVLACEPEHISSYSLIVEEGTPFFEKYSDAPPMDEETDRLLYERTKEVLASAGYERYEISNYAKKDFACQHNLKYWKREPYLGLGLGAASYLREKRFSNVREMEKYIYRVTEQMLPVDEDSIEKLSKEDEKAEFMYLGLRCMKGVSMEDFSRCFGEEMMVCYKKEIDTCIQEGLLEKRGDFIRLSPRGIDVSNRVFSLFV